MAFFDSHLMAEMLFDESSEQTVEVVITFTVTGEHKRQRFATVINSPTGDASSAPDMRVHHHISAERRGMLVADAQNELWEKGVAAIQRQFPGAASFINETRDKQAKIRSAQHAEREFYEKLFALLPKKQFFTKYDVLPLQEHPAAFGYALLVERFGVEAVGVPAMKNDISLCYNFFSWSMVTSIKNFDYSLATEMIGFCQELGLSLLDGFKEFGWNELYRI